MAVTERVLAAMNIKNEAFFRELGARIATARKAQGMTQVQLAEHLGVAQQTLAHYEVGRARVAASNCRPSPKCWTCPSRSCFSAKPSPGRPASAAPPAAFSSRSRPSANCRRRSRIWWCRCWTPSWPSTRANRQPLAAARRTLQRRPSGDGLNRSSGGAVLAALKQISAAP